MSVDSYNILRFPREILIKVFSNLSLEDVLRLSKTCKTLYNLLPTLPIIVQNPLHLRSEHFSNSKASYLRVKQKKFESLIRRTSWKPCSIKASFYIPTSGGEECCENLISYVSSKLYSVNAWITCSYYNWKQVLQILNSLKIDREVVLNFLDLRLEEDHLMIKDLGFEEAKAVLFNKYFAQLSLRVHWTATYLDVSNVPLPLISLLQPMFPKVRTVCLGSFLSEYLSQDFISQAVQMLNNWNLEAVSFSLNTYSLPRILSILALIAKLNIKTVYMFYQLPEENNLMSSNEIGDYDQFESMFSNIWMFIRANGFESKSSVESVYFRNEASYGKNCSPQMKTLHFFELLNYVFPKLKFLGYFYYGDDLLNDNVLGSDGTLMEEFVKLLRDMDFVTENPNLEEVTLSKCILDRVRLSDGLEDWQISPDGTWTKVLGNATWRLCQDDDYLYFTRELNKQ